MAVGCLTETYSKGVGMAALPTGTVTFLFTDLEGSTRLWEAHPEAMKGALARHDAILREVVGAHGGHVVKMTGDGVHAAFQLPADAMTAAAEGQRRLASELWTVAEPLRVRMGIHTGVVEDRDGDYFGSAVNRAARLMGVAHGGQILVSHASEELLRDQLADGTALLDLGELRLRDLSRPERVFQLAAGGLEEVFPPVRSLEAFPGNLPSQLSSFVGRDKELASVPDALRESRLVTLIGVGGVGKTRLAAQVAAEVLPRFADGAWFCELATAGDAAMLVETVAATIGARPRPGVSLEASLVEFLRPRALLMVLDNCEHLLDAAGRLAESVLGDCAGVRILATSREALGVDGERLIPVRSLGLPADGDPATATACDAVRLFESRGAAARPGFAIDASNAPSVVEICSRLDGIPLAIELAAARLAAMSPAEIAGHLDARFRLLTGGRRLAVERHQTLRSAVDWSYALLGDHERAVFDRLGAFVGSFDSSAASAVAATGGIESWDVLDALTSLVSKSMLTAEETSDGTTRYQLLETLRQYARERLDETGGTDPYRRRHAEHYARFAEQAGPALLGPDELLWRRHLHAELDNLRAAVTWALDSEDDADGELAVRIVAALSFQATADRAAGISTWAQRVLPRSETARPDLRVGVLGAASWDATFRLDYDQARELGNAALDLARAHGILNATALGSTCQGAMYSGRFDEALEIAHEVAAASTDAPDLDHASVVTAVVPAMVALLRGEMAHARDNAEHALQLARQSQNPSSIALASYTYGWVLMHDDPPAALRAFDESIDLVRQGATDMVYAHVLVRAASLRAASGDQSALTDLREAVAYAHDVGSLVTMMAVLDYGIRVLASLDHSAVGAVLVGFLDDGHEIALNPVGGPEGLAREQARAKLAADLGPDEYQAARARGAQLSYEAYIDYSLREIDRLVES